MIQFYQSCVYELEEKGRMLEQEIGFIRDLSLKYMQEGTTLKERVKNLE